MQFTQEQLGEIHLAAFRAIASTRPKGEIVGNTWFIRVTKDATWLITPYNEKRGDGTWAEREIESQLDPALATDEVQS